MSTTEFDGSIESAIDSIVEPEEAETVEVEAEEVDESEDESDDEPSNSEVDEEVDEDSDDETEDEEDEAEEHQEQTFTVKVNGKETSVTLDELKRGYSGQQFIQQQMQQNAQFRKQAEQVYQQLLSERQQVASFLQQAQSGLPREPVPPSRDLFQSDPIGYMEQKLQYDEAKSQYDSAIQQAQSIAQQQSQAEQAAMQVHIQQELNRLREVVPEFADKVKGKALREDVISMGQEVYGFSMDDLQAVTDSRALHVLSDAIKWRKLQSQKKDVVKTTKAKVVKPGSKVVKSKTSALQKQQAKLKRSGSLEDALGLIMQT